MDKKLKKLFDYQQFEKNEKLKKLTHEAESRYGKELSDEELELVSAVGEPKIDASIGGCNIDDITGDFIGNYIKNNG